MSTPTKDIVLIAEKLGRLNERSRWLQRVTELILDPRTPSPVRQALVELCGEMKAEAPVDKFEREAPNTHG